MSEQNETPRPVCVVCRRAQTDWTVCVRCVARVDRMLGEILEAHALARLPEYLMPAWRGEAGPIGGHREPPLPLDLAVLDIAHGEDALGVLESWERWWREAFGLAPYGVASGSRLEAAHSHESAQEVTLAGVVGFLRAQWPLAAEKVEPPPEEFASEVRSLHRRALGALGMLEPAPWSFPCPADLDDHLCGYRLRIDYHGRDVLIHCPRCGTDWTLQRLRLVGQSAGTPAWVDAETAARALRCDVGHLGPMVRDGRIRRRGEGEFRRYDINSIEEDASVTGRHADTPRR